MGLYKIDETKMITFSKEDGMRRINEFHTKHRWDLPNLSTYDSDGNLLKEEGLVKYDMEFSRKLVWIKQTFEIKDYLNYHFDYADDKIMLLKHLRSVILYSAAFHERPFHRQVLANWIDEKEKLFQKDEMKTEDVFDPLVFKNLSQKLLLLESLGVLKAISDNAECEISSRKMGRILADLLGVKDLTRHLRYFNVYSIPNDKNNPRTESNLMQLHRNLSALKLDKLAKEVEGQIIKLNSA